MEQELIAKISKGTKMDQIYLSKERISEFSIGNYVLIKPLSAKSPEIEEKQKEQLKLNFYNIKNIPEIKFRIAEEIFKNIQKYSNQENIILTGSFLNDGFNFNDLDVIIIKEKKQQKNEEEILKSKLEEKFGVNFHILFLTNKELIEGLSSDPLYENMLSKCISLKKIVFNIKRKINPKILDLHLLKSKTLIENYDILNGKEKYYLTKNMLSILLFIEGKRISDETISKELKNSLNTNPKEIQENFLNKKEFIKVYKEIYEKTFNKIMNILNKENQKNKDVSK